MEENTTNAEILREEKNILKEERNILRRINRDTLIIVGAVILLIALGAGLLMWQSARGRISIEKAEIRAPEIALSSRRGGSPPRNSRKRRECCFGAYAGCACWRGTYQNGNGRYNYFNQKINRAIIRTRGTCRYHG